MKNEVFGMIFRGIKNFFRFVFRIKDPSYVPLTAEEKIQLKRRRRRETTKNFMQNYQLYLFMLIPFIWLIMFEYIPLYGLQLAFRNFNPVHGIRGSEFVAWDNFTRFFQSWQFRRVVTNTIILSFYQLLAGFPIPILFALSLNALRSVRFRKISQMLTYMPNFIATVVIVSIMMQIFNPIVGAYGIIYRFFFEGMPPNIWGDPAAFRHLYVWGNVWQGMGWGSIIYIAALSSVDSELHEAAQIDGASRLKRCWHIDIPAIIPTITIMFILRMGNIMSIGFERVFLMQNPMNLSTSEVISTYVYKVSIGAAIPQFSYGAAVGLFNTVINFAMLIFVNQLARKGSTSLW